MLQMNTSKIIALAVGAVAAVVVLHGASSAFAADSVYIDNFNTGARSNNRSSVNVRRNHNVDITHRTNIDNDFDLRFNTGDNRADFNTGDGFVRSGDANADIMIRNNSSNGADHWMMTSFMPDYSGYDVSASNRQTGFNSDNYANVDINSSTDIRIDHRTDINNDVNVNANTGNNRASGNTGNGYVSSGDVNVGVMIEN